MTRGPFRARVASASSLHARQQLDAVKDEDIKTKEGDFKVVFEKGPMWSSLASRPAAQGGSGPKNASGLNDWWAAPHSSDTSWALLHE